MKSSWLVLMYASCTSMSSRICGNIKKVFHCLKIFHTLCVLCTLSRGVNCMLRSVWKWPLPAVWLGSRGRGCAKWRSAPSPPSAWGTSPATETPDTHENSIPRHNTKSCFRTHGEYEEIPPTKLPILDPDWSEIGSGANLSVTTMSTIQIVIITTRTSYTGICVDCTWSWETFILLCMEGVLQ